jgi:putative SOS response-associated peptidase YedK
LIVFQSADATPAQGVSFGAGPILASVRRMSRTIAACYAAAMCGRFTQRYTWREIHDLYGLTGAARNLQAHYNIAPTDTVDVVKPAGRGATELVPMRWGLIPYWWKKPLKQLPATGVLLDKADFEPWLNGAAGAELLRPAAEDRLRMWPVSRHVNKTGSGDDDPTLIDEVAA